MGKRTAAEANVDHDATTITTFFSMSSQPAPTTSDNASSDRQLLESPVPLAWSCASVEPAGAYDTRVRSALPKQLKMPRGGDDEDEDNQDGDRVSELSSTTPPPLIAPRPRRIVSTELIFQTSERQTFTASAFKPTPLDLSSRRSFRPIGGDRPDVEITSPPPRAANPVVQDTRFKNMQRLDLRLDARAAPLQPFHRPYAQRRVSNQPPQ